ncbi:hypothetical protein [Acetobacter malorum]|uniref:hypothetical protein n=1 Tax=Acetobacter malorum TaxID=178901 RepID=UPI0012E77935|nr:hypothetical protein [Acetobacter malorum]
MAGIHLCAMHFRLNFLRDIWQGIRLSGFKERRFSVFIRPPPLPDKSRANVRSEIFLDFDKDRIACHVVTTTKPMATRAREELDLRLPLLETG